MSETVTIDEALKRGYQWIICGYNHKEGHPLIAPIHMMRVFCPSGRYKICDLQRAKLLADGPQEPEPVADIPMEESRR